MFKRAINHLKENYFNKAPISGDLDMVEAMSNANYKANRFLADMAYIFAFLSIIWLIVSFFGIWGYNRIIIDILSFTISFIFQALVIIIAKQTECKGKQTKFYMIGLFLLSSLILSMYLNYVGCFLFALVLIVSIQYYDVKFTIGVAIVSELLYALTVLLGSIINYSTGTFDLYLIVNLEQEMNIDISNKVSSLGSYIASQFNYAYIGFSILLLLVAIVCSINALRGKEMIIEESETMSAKSKSEYEANEAKMNIMISQIQPHFIYNTLNTIYYLCEKDSKMAQNAISEFSDYLRENLNFKTKNDIVPFKKELEHIKKYLSLEKLRFEDDLNIVYDIQCDTFKVPSLSIQPLVENAVKHGICKKAGGGTVKIIARDILECFEVIIKDDGVGFDVDEELDDGRVHLGLENTRERLENLIQAKFILESYIDIGTTITIRIPKEYYYEDISR